MEKNKNKTKICGKKDKTENKPAKIPSQINPCTQEGLEESHPLTQPVMESVSNPNKLAKITPGELIPPSPKTPSNAVPSKVTKSSPNNPPKYKKFSEKVK